MSMIEKVSAYYKAIFARIHTSQESPYFLPNNKQNLINGNGTTIVLPGGKEAFGIIDSLGNKYYIINYYKFSHQLRDRQNIYFELKIFPDVSNIHQWGETTELQSVIPATL